MEFSRQEYWSRQTFLFPGDLSDSGIEPRSPVLQADSLQPESPGTPKPYLFLELSNKVSVLKFPVKVLGLFVKTFVAFLKL